MSSKDAQRAEEFNRLLVTQANVTRNMKYGFRPDSDEKATIEARGVRLNELAELLPGAKANAEHAPFEPGAYVNERIASWLKANPLLLSTRMVDDLIEGVGPNGTVTVVIGDGAKGGYWYTCHADDLESANGQIRLNVPEGVAEHFRQQGRRQIQREFADLMAVKSHLRGGS